MQEGLERMGTPHAGLFRHDAGDADESRIVSLVSGRFKAMRAISAWLYEDEK